MPDWSIKIAIWFVDKYWETLIGALVIAFGVSVYTWFKSRKNKYLHPIVPAVFTGIVCLAGLLLVQDSLRHQGEDELRTQLEKEQKAPDYIEKKIRSWMDEAHIASVKERPQGEERWRMRLTWFDMGIIVAQMNTADGLVRIETAMWTMEHATERLNKLSVHERIRLSHLYELELLRLGVAFTLVAGKKGDQIVLSDIFAMDHTTSKAEFMNRMFLLKRGTGLVKIMYDDYFSKHPSAK